jgi:integrase/recombinase XerD
MKDASRVRVTGPLERYAVGFVAELSGAGYRPGSAAVHVRLLAHLSRWLEAEGLVASRLSEEQVERFRRLHVARVPSLRGAQGLVPLLSYLRGVGAVPAAAVPSLTAADELLERYRAYLIMERGLARETARGYVDLLRAFVESRMGSSGELLLWDLSAADVLGFLLVQSGWRSRKSAKSVVTALPSLLGFLHIEGLIARPLAGAVPSVAGWRLAGLPRALDGDQVRRLLDSCDRATATGRRDFAIMTLLVRLGLRRSEVAKLQLEDIDWHAGELVVRGKGDRVERLPLPADAGEAIAAYLRDGRPVALGGREVFARVKAPHRALTWIVGPVIRLSLSGRGRYS